MSDIDDNARLHEFALTLQLLVEWADGEFDYVLAAKAEDVRIQLVERLKTFS